MATIDTIGYATFDSIPDTLTFDEWGVDAFLTPARADFGSTFYSATVSSVRGLSPVRFDNAQAFYTHTLQRGAVNLLPSLYTSAQTFYAPSVGRGPVGLAPSPYTNTSTFPAAAITTQTALLPARFNNAQTFYAAEVLRGTITLSAPLASDPDAFYAPSAQYLEPRYAFPVADLSQGGWTPSAGADLYAMLDEQPASDADYISATTNTVCVLRLAPVVDPQTSVGQVLKFRARSASGSTLIARLKQGGTTIATGTQVGVAAGWTDYAVALTPAECDAITDYTDLRVELEAA